MMKSRRGRYRRHDRGLVQGAMPEDATRPKGEEICPKCRGQGQIGGQECPLCGGSGKSIDAIGEE
jgi:DnaJ-class molecular chaperone